MPHLDLNGTRINYRLAGEGQPGFVLVHGGGCALTDWGPQVAALGAEFATVAADLRGHGGSGGAPAELHVAQWAEDVNGLVAALGLGPAVLVGHSLGTRIVAEAAWRRPDLASALVLVDGSRTVGGLAATTPAEADPPEQDMSLGAVIDRTVGERAARAVRDQVAATMSAAAASTMAAAVKALADWDAERADAVFAGLPPEMPVLAIQSTYHDRFTPRRSLAREDETTPYLDFLRAVRPGLAVRVLPATGHFSMLERPEAVTALIRDFGLAAWRARTSDDRG
jgi:pimeloyl-ACP methyl ester carboxylesterase